MSSWLAAVGLLAAFVFLGRAFGLTARSRTVLATTRESMSVMRTASMSDEQKEAALQAHAIALFKSFFTLSIGLAAAALLPAALLWLCDRLGWLSFERVLAVSLSPAFLVVSGVVVILTLVMGRRSAAPDAEGYSGVDRALHRVAFATYEVQADLADIEDRLFAAHLGSVTNQRPVFITSLPRAGTTLLLECCAGLDEFASHTYRDMPFVMIPCLWSSFSGAFRREGQMKPRAHGDGMQIDFDSPEALEEVLWLKFWATQYQPDRILPWPSKPRAEFTTFFARHMRKIAYVRRGDRSEGVRYISKNNLNIARIPLVRQMFPDATIVVPVRAPLDHCSSLLQQHRQFSELHARDEFASRYMRAIGHFDFGAHLRPVDFDRWYAGRTQRDAHTLAFWLEYWIAAYRHLLTSDQALVHFLDYDRLCADPIPGLRRLAERIDCRDVDRLLSAAAGIHASRTRSIDTSAVPQELLRRAQDTHAALCGAARA
jgi:sulfotransferase family protein